MPEMFLFHAFHFYWYFQLCFLYCCFVCSLLGVVVVVVVVYVRFSIDGEKHSRDKAQWKTQSFFDQHSGKLAHS